MTSRIKTALTVAGSDPTGGAGLQADIRVFESFGVHGLSIPAALTIQNTIGVEDAMAVPEDFLRRGLKCLLSDITPDAMKTGMLYTPYAVEAVEDAVRRYNLKNLVVDPVTVSSSGKTLVEDGASDLIMRKLFPLARVITPNIDEAGLFTGIKIMDENDMKEAAKRLMDTGPDAVIITGGHLDGEAVDMLYDGKRAIKIGRKKIRGEFHGTGCSFSAAITALLALGKNTHSAFKGAKEFMEYAITHAVKPGRGMGILRFRRH